MCPPAATYHTSATTLDINPGVRTYSSATDCRSVAPRPNGGRSVAETAPVMQLGTSYNGLKLRRKRFAPRHHAIDISAGRRPQETVARMHGDSTFPPRTHSRATRPFFQLRSPFSLPPDASCLLSDFRRRRPSRCRLHNARLNHTHTHTRVRAVEQISCVRRRRICSRLSFLDDQSATGQHGR